MRWIAVPLLLATLVGAAACGEEDATRDENATPTLSSATDTPTMATEEAARDEKATPPPSNATDAPAIATREATRDENAPRTPPSATDAPPIATDAQRLRSLLPTEGELGAAFPDLAPFEQALSLDGLGQEYEHVELENHGFVAGYAAFYNRPADASNTPHIYISFAMFGDAVGASSSLWELIAKEFGGPGTSTFEVGEGDESYGLTSPGLTVLLRQDRVVGFIAMVQPGGADRREAMRQLARDAAVKIENALAQ